ncbi:MAG: glucose-6-phosphate isomerase [Thermoleophilia bacterium]|nr:glucose-6-phosphate isomerase [Thermoleophilia bacterium]
MDRLTVDIQRCLASAVGDRGLTAEHLADAASTLEQARAKVVAGRGRGSLAFMELPYQDVAALLEFAEERRGRYDALLVIGIGGSALGTVALANALLPFFYNELSPAERGQRPRLYVLDNVDPDETAAVLSRLDFARTLVNVISKSGTTAESMAGYMVVREKLEKLVGQAGLKDHLVFTTDPQRGALREIGQTLGVPIFDIPPGVGGRFSVLTPVGLLPAALTGMDVHGLLAGARDMDRWIAETSGWDNPAATYAGVQYLEDRLFGRRVSVMMPYAARLRELAGWYRQLWAESLGKEVDRQGRTVHVGPLPVRALGVTDQHSQLQLYAEGPDDKVITFIGVDEFGAEVAIPAARPEEEPLAYLGGRSLADLLWAEQKATAWALAQKGRPSLTITLPRVDPYHVGALMYLLEVATAIAGELYDIDAFNQPGVELSKQATYALMGRPGFEELAAQIS